MSGLLNDFTVTVIGILMGLIAYGLGRNFLIWFLFGMIFPVLSPFVLIIRHLQSPRKSPPWVSYRFYQIRSKLWSRKLKPEDFNEQKPDGPAL